MKAVLVFIVGVASLLANDVHVEHHCFPYWHDTLTIDKMVFEEQTEDHFVRIFDNQRFGRILTLDGKIQFTEVEEFAYHEMLVHVPMVAHPHPRHVLIIGGGDGGSLREVLKHSTVEKATLVDISREVIDYSQKYLPSVSDGAFDDPRSHVIIQDGIDFIANTHEKFDVIICDSTDPTGPAKPLFSSQFYGLCQKALNPDGIMVNNSFHKKKKKETFLHYFKNRSDHFKDTRHYMISLPSTEGGFLRAGIDFGWATNSDIYKTFSKKKLHKRAQEIRGKLKFYNPEIHKAAFVLPEDTKRMGLNTIYQK